MILMLMGRGMDCDSFSSFSSSMMMGVVVVIDEKEISIGSVSLLTPSMECSRI